MPRPSKALTRENTLRTTETERLILEQEQKRFAEFGLTLSLNDVMRALIRRAAIPVPTTKAEAQRIIDQHWDDCSECGPGAGPRCPDGVYIRDCYTLLRRALRAHEPPPAPPAPAPAPRPVMPAFPPGTLLT
ncbi:hypothetical protein ACIPWE_40320 [Streptomyces sp. NPDC090073]|uniref:hypothetical protein n=1 Tax=Streptomyces sp. NPDC090073 TaxID=3365936 RepID=UPI0037F8E802